MPSSEVTQNKVLELLKQFMSSSGRQVPAITSETHLTSDLGLKSDEGVDFTLDLCDAFGVELPLNFNPFVHDNGRKGRRFGEMVSEVARLVSVEEVAL